MFIHIQHVLLCCCKIHVQCEKSKCLEEYLTRKGHLMQARDRKQKITKKQLNKTEGVGLHRIWGKLTRG